MAKLPLFIPFLLALIKFAACGILSIDEIYSKADYTDEELAFEQPRVAAGIDAKPLENLDYARLAIVFQNYFKTCGGSLFSGIYVLTTASCVFNREEGLAYAINVTFPQSRNKKIFVKHDIRLHPGFDFETKANDIAIIKLETPVSPDGRSIEFAQFSTNADSDAFAGKILRFCGMGSIANYPTYPHTLKCTELNIIPGVECESIPNTICSYWHNKDNNVCSGDYGGPLYEVIGSGQNIVQKVVGIASFSPDSRPQTSCLDGHRVIHMQVGAFVDTIQELINT